ncbi:hypothetical protein J6590_036021 [Homalodisca vitripennis]|nr:hypothetical protein J6590_036021 [Homalodisca vitripennis]
MGIHFRNNSRTSSEISLVEDVGKRKRWRLNQIEFGAIKSRTHWPPPLRNANNKLICFLRPHGLVLKACIPTLASDWTSSPQILKI